MRHLGNRFDRSEQLLSSLPRAHTHTPVRICTNESDSIWTNIECWKRKNSLLLLLSAVTVCVNLLVFTVKFTDDRTERCLMMFVWRTIDIEFFLSKKDIWSQLVENDRMFAWMRFLIFLFCFLTFLLHLPVFPFFSSLSFFLYRWIIIMMHTHL